LSEETNMSKRRLQELEQVARAAIQTAQGLGATACAVNIFTCRSIETRVRMRRPERVIGGNFKTLWLRAYVGKRNARDSITDFDSPEALRDLAASVIARAKTTEPNEFEGLPAYEELATSFPELDLVDGELDMDHPDIDRYVRLATQAEAAALDNDSRIVNSAGATFAARACNIVQANSLGFLGSYQTTRCSLELVVVALENRLTSKGDAKSESRRLRGLMLPEEFGVRAAKRALAHLGGYSLPNGEVPVVLDPVCARGFLGHFAAAVDGSCVAGGSSFLAGRLGEAITSPCLTVIDDGLLMAGLGSQPFDNDGLPCCRRVIVDRGRLEAYLLGTYAARMLGMRPNGGGITNLYITPGAISPEQIIQSVNSGLYLTGISPSGVNVATGDFSLGARGLWIEGGEIGCPIAGITISGNVLDMFQNIEAVGNDLNILQPGAEISAPTIKVARLMVAGN
jgi:PmbA protein